MTPAAEPDLRYPTGTFQPVETPLSPAVRFSFVADLASAPAAFRDAVRDLNPEQLATPYRPGGWNVAQTVHHVADSHMNSYIRFKLALTEDEPTIKPYDEAAWAELADSSLPVDVSIQLLDMLHRRWVTLLQSMKLEEWKRSFRHPERGLMDLDQTLALYAWHGKHHAAHITGLRSRKGW